MRRPLPCMNSLILSGEHPMNTNHLDRPAVSYSINFFSSPPFLKESCLFPGPQVPDQGYIIYYVDGNQHHENFGIHLKKTSHQRTTLNNVSKKSSPKYLMAGFLMLELSLALLISSLAAGLAFWSAHRAEMASQAMLQADQLHNVARAAETLVMEHYHDYQTGQSVVRNGIELQFGSDQGNALSPTLDQLRAMALGLSPGSNYGSYKNLHRASYQTHIERIPAGCEKSSSGASCNITGLVCLDQPVRELSNASNQDNSEIDGFGLGKMIGKIGGDAGISLVGSSSKITGAGGAWSANNPIHNSPAGVICVRIGFGASGFGQFLRVRDQRDPQFQNNLSAQGNISSYAGSIGAGTGKPEDVELECRLGEILNSGAFWSRSRQCVKRAWIEGHSGEIGLANERGTTRVRLQSNGEISSLNDAGEKKAGFSYEGLNSLLKADELRNNQGNAGLNASGEVFGESVVIGLSAVAGQSCPTNHAMVWGSTQHHLKLLKCENQVWVMSGTTQGIIGQACTTNGEIGESPNKVSIICVGNIWQTTTSRMGNFSTSATYLAKHGSQIQKPACGSGGVPKIKQIPQTIDSRKLYSSFKAQDNGHQWTALMTDAEGQATLASSLIETGCWYD